MLSLLPTSIAAASKPVAPLPVLLVAPPSVAQHFKSELHAVSARVQTGPFVENPRLSGLMSQAAKLGCMALVLVAKDAAYAGVWPVGSGTRMKQTTMLREGAETIPSLALRVAEYIDAWRPLPLAKAPVAHMTTVKTRRNATASKTVAAPAKKDRQRTVAGKSDEKRGKERKRQPPAATARSGVGTPKPAAAKPKSSRHIAIDAGVATSGPTLGGLSGSLYTKLGGTVGIAPDSPWQVRGWFEWPVEPFSVSSREGSATMDVRQIALGAFYAARWGRYAGAIGVGLGAHWLHVAGLADEPDMEREATVVLPAAWLAADIRVRLGGGFWLRSGIQFTAVTPQPVVMIGEERHPVTWSNQARAAVTLEYAL